MVPFSQCSSENIGKKIITIPFIPTIAIFSLYFSPFDLRMFYERNKNGECLAPKSLWYQLYGLEFKVSL